MMTRKKGLWKTTLIFIICILFIYMIIPRNDKCLTTEDAKNEQNVAKIIKHFQEGQLNAISGNGNGNKSDVLQNLPDLFLGYDKLSFKDLENNFIPNHVYYMWCYNRTIEFRQYLSILAIWKTIRPDSITLFTKYNISDSNEHYNVWLTDLLVSIPCFKVQKLPASSKGDVEDCGMTVAFDILKHDGGMYFSEDFFPLKSLRFVRKNKFNVAMTKNMKQISFISSSRRNERLKSFIKLYKNNITQPLVTGLHFCDILENVNKTILQSKLCVHVHNVLPAHIMHADSEFGKSARKILYGNSEQVKVKPLLPGLIPNIFHMVWFGHKPMDFTMYLCLRSILTIVKPEKVYIHGDGLMYGEYLQKLKKDPRVVYIHRETPTHVFGHQILYTQHRSDIIRADVLLKYGGIYSDWDVLWLKPVDDLISKQHDTILNFDHMPRPGFPDSINLGVLMSKPGSHYIKHWQDSLVNYRSRDFFFNAIELPYKTFEKYPETVYIEPHLQVMCYYLKCHPTFHPEYRNFNVDKPFNWTKDAYSIHFTYPDPSEYANETALRHGKGMFADIGNFILDQSFAYD
ncbi:uncharacterized protein [Mytilus edulis]|uniref:uncharacterized protein n=1 Tax=Mytilus edulis TaxID=6550 RepID=UPI0039EF9605